MAHERSPIIVAIADGRVVDVGSHDQLMAARASATTAA
jgi:predicted amidohydrolase YtcJ